MRVLFLMIAFPDLDKNTNLYTDLALEFKKNGHDVSVATVLDNDKYNESYFEEKMGIKILRVKTGRIFNVGFIRKGINTLLLPYYIKSELKKRFKDKFDLCIYPTPPITYYSVIKWILRRDKCQTYLILRDIFPQNAIDLGIMRKRLIYRYFKYIENRLYHISDRIGTMSQGNTDYIVRHNKIDRDKIDLLPNWKTIKPDSQSLDQIDFREKYNLRNKFIVIFGGVIGIAQELSFLIEIAERIKNNTDIVFLILGEGNQKESLKIEAKNRNLSNIIFKDKIPTNEFKSLIKQCDVGLISLNRKFTIPNIPSKTLDYFEAKLPIIAYIDRNTDYGKIVDESGCGYWCLTGDSDGFENILLKLFASKDLKKMGYNGYNYLVKNLTTEKTYNIIMNRELQ